MLRVLHEKYIRWSRLITQLQKMKRGRTAFACVDRTLLKYKNILLVLLGSI